jgi:hypothetical protein
VFFPNKQLPLTQVFSDGNPKYKLAFKSCVDEEIGEGVIAKVIWQPNATQYKPVAELEVPVFIHMKSVSRVSLHNENWCKERNVGVGSRVQISVNPTPIVTAVLSPGVMPPPPIEELKDLLVVQAKRLEKYIKLLDVKGAGQIMCEKLITLGYNPGSLFRATEEDASKIGGLNGVKLVEALRLQRPNVTIKTIVAGMGLLGDGIALKKLEKVSADFMLHDVSIVDSLGGVTAKSARSNFDTAKATLAKWFSEDEIRELSR